MYVKSNTLCWTTALLISLTWSLPSLGQTPPQDIEQEIPGRFLEYMSDARVETLLKRLDTPVSGGHGKWTFTLLNREVAVVAHEAAGRIRIMTPILTVDEGLSDALMKRILQANFDSALDARYAVADNILWGVYIHPLNPLTEQQFFGAIKQVISIAETFGETFSSGGPLFGGGDSSEELRKLQQAPQTRGAPL